MSDDCWPTHYGPQREQVPVKNRYFSILFNGTTSEIDCGDDASVQGLPNSDFTVDAWIQADGYGENNEGRIIDKWSNFFAGWYFTVHSGVGLRAEIEDVFNVADTRIGLDDFTADGAWHHVVMAWDTGTQSIFMAVDGTWAPDYDTQTVGGGAYPGDVGVDLVIGNNAAGNYTFDGSIQWLRISDTLRWAVGVDFTPPGMCAPPVVDADTVELWVLDEGEGTDAEAAVDAGNDGTIADGTWQTC